MNQINATLTTSGNSVAVRLPKDLLRMSGLGKEVTLEALEGKIIISKATSQRQNWDQRIRELTEKVGDPTREFRDMQATVEELAWDGPSYEDWKQQHDQLP